MKQGMPAELRRRCDLALKRYQDKKATQDEALQELFRIMKIPDAAVVRASEFQKYVDAVLGKAEPPAVSQLDAEIFKSWKPS